MARLICVCCIQLVCQYHEDGISVFSVLGVFVQSLLLQLKHYKHLLREFLLASSDNPWLRCPPSMLAPDSLSLLRIEVPFPDKACGFHTAPVSIQKRR